MGMIVFPDAESITLLIIIASLVLIITFFIVSFIVFEKRRSAKNDQINAQSNTVIVFVINIKRGFVTYFNRASLKRKKRIEISQFYDLFASHESDKMKQWIFSICTSFNDANQYLEVSMIGEHNKNYFTVFKLNKYNAEKGTILLESNTLKYINPSNMPSRKYKGMISGVVKRSVMEKLINSNVGVDGYTFAVRFYYVHQAALQNENIERFTLMALKNEVYPFLYNGKNPRQIVESNSNEIFLFDMKMSERDSAMALAKSISLSLKKTLSVRGFSDVINFAIGVVENRMFYQNYATIINQAQNACIKAQQDGEQIIFAKYSRTSKIDVDKFSSDVDHLLQPGNLRFLFRPIIDIRTSNVVGYFNSVRAYDSPFAATNEMSKYAARVGKGKELFATLAKNIIPKYISENRDPKAKLFFYVSMYDIENILSVLPQIPRAEEANLILVFDEQEVKDNSTSIMTLHDTFDVLKKNNYKIALQLFDKDLILDPQTYLYFDYFIAGTSMLGEIRKNNRIRLSIHTLIERLLRYNKPIIATDLEGWQSVELIIKAGIYYISSEVISVSNDMIIPIDKKKMDRLNNMANKYIKK